MQAYELVEILSDALSGAGLFPCQDGCAGHPDTLGTLSMKKHYIDIVGKWA